MSYILDALKKAERERGVTQVPTITTVHNTVAAPRVRLWIVSGILVLCIAAVIWFFLPSLRTNTASTPSDDREPGQEASRTGLDSMEESQAGSSSPSTQSSGIPVSGNIALSDEIPKHKTQMDSATHVTLSQSAEEIAAGKDQEDAADEDGLDPSAEAATGSLPGGYSPGISTDGGAGASQTGSNLIESEPVTPSSDSDRGKSASLREAMEGMTISVLMFSEIESERLVFINGRKYVEGDYIQEDCLLESITQEGAVLNYKGERAVLRPGP